MNIENPMINFKEEEPKVVTECSNCKDDLYDHDTFLELNGDHFCDSYCLITGIGVEVVEGWDV